MGLSFLEQLHQVHEAFVQVVGECNFCPVFELNGDVFDPGTSSAASQALQEFVRTLPSASPSSALLSSSSSLPPLPPRPLDR